MAKKKAKSGKKAVSKAKASASKAKKTVKKAKNAAKKGVKTAKTLLGKLAQRSAQLVIDSGLLGKAPKPAAKRAPAKQRQARSK
jgi:hypothetical protein